MIIIKSGRDLEAMRYAGSIAGAVLKDVSAMIEPGITTKSIDEFAASRIAHYGAKSAFLGYRKYPCNICISVNEEVVHGIASDRKIKLGDIVSLDVGVKANGFIGDTACTVPVGSCDFQMQKLIDVTEQALYKGIEQALAGNRVVDISRAIQHCVEGNGFSVVREFVGHGVGRSVHEDPQIPNFVDGKSSPKLRPGMTIAIEPMVNMGLPEIKILNDCWTVVTRDGRPSAHFEHTVLVTDAEPEILTCQKKSTSTSKVG